jgi:hypothetical protein
MTFENKFDVETAIIPKNQRNYFKCYGIKITKQATKRAGLKNIRMWEAVSSGRPFALEPHYRGKMWWIFSFALLAISKWRW